MKIRNINPCYSGITTIIQDNLSIVNSGLKEQHLLDLLTDCLQNCHSPDTEPK